MTNTTAGLMGAKCTAIPTGMKTNRTFTQLESRASLQKHPNVFLRDGAARSDRDDPLWLFAIIGSPFSGSPWRVAVDVETELGLPEMESI